MKLAHVLLLGVFLLSFQVHAMEPVEHIRNSTSVKANLDQPTVDTPSVSRSRSISPATSAFSFDEWQQELLTLDEPLFKLLWEECSSQTITGLDLSFNDIVDVCNESS